jgi:hypothetical protein
MRIYLFSGVWVGGFEQVYAVRLVYVSFVFQAIAHRAMPIGRSVTGNCIYMWCLRMRPSLIHLGMIARFEISKSFEINDGL